MNVRHILFLLIIFVPVFASAQGPYPSNKAWFEVTEKSGCAPFNVTITNVALVHSCDDADPCQITWGDSSAPTIINSSGPFSHTYTTPGTYTLEVNYSGGQGPDIIAITVYPNIQPAFEVYTCNGNDVQIRVTDTNYDFYIFDSGGPETEIPRGSAPVQHTLSSGTISVRGKNANAADNCTPPATRTIVAPLPPFTHTLTELRVINTTTIDLQLAAQQNVLYRLEMSVNGGAFQNLGNLVNVSTRTVTNLNTNSNYYCFRLGKVNPCLGTIDYSATICSANLTVSAQNNANNLSWATSTAGVDDFTIIKNGVSLSPATLATVYSDTDVECQTEYEYQVVTNYPAGTSYSAVRTVTAISTDTPNPVTEITTAVDNTAVSLTWQEDAVFDAVAYTIYKSVAGGPAGQIATGLTTPHYTDENYLSDNNVCYRIHYEDVCGNTSSAATNEVCPIVLSYTTNNNDEIILSWPAYTGWASGVQHYELYKYNLRHEPVGMPANVGLTTAFTDNDLADQGYYYVVRAIPVDPANGESVSNEILAVRGLRFAYPKAFTPDNQGPAENETFRVFVTAEFIESFDMKIFNRWGELIFSTSDLLKGWDGRYNGSPQPEGTYTFVATLKDRSGRVYKRDGAVMLLRKK